MPDLRLVIFDVDGTIAETADLHREAWNHAFAIHGIGWHWTRAIFSRLLPLPDGIARLRAFGMGVDPSQFASLLAGAVFVEYIFGWNGLGKEIVDSLNNLDVPVLIGSVLTIAMIFILINIFVDIIYTWLDPRIKFN